MCAQIQGVIMAKRYNFLESEVDSSGDESLEQLIGLKVRPKRVKTVPHRYRNDQLDAVLAEAALEEKFCEFNICAHVISASLAYPLHTGAY